MYFVVNALIAARQTVLEDTEVESGKVYKYRSATYVGPNQPYYFGQVKFEKGFETTEWQLDRTRQDFEEFHKFTSRRKSWASILEMETNSFTSNFGELIFPRVFEYRLMRPAIQSL